MDKEGFTESQEMQKAISNLTETLANVCEQMILDGKATDMPDAVAKLMGGVFTQEQLEEMGGEAILTRGREADNLLEAIRRTEPRKE